MDLNDIWNKFLEQIKSKVSLKYIWDILFIEKNTSFNVIISSSFRGLSKKIFVS